MIVEAIKAFFVAVAEFFKLKSKTYCIDLIEESHAKQDKIIDEIHSLLQNPSPGSIDRVNILQLQLQQERDMLADLSANCPKGIVKPDNNDV